ncbi:trp operon leader peptide [Escherichia coli]|nr:trp operon leader peptide [Escherichia coli]HAH0546839.1 trp operon leader peptide [Escherichia coli]HAV8323529.1 trp operon leader peptide [Escherichia coli]HCP8173767.1 trp operon leader peptide [Escherichia coli]
MKAIFVQKGWWRTS